MSYVNLVSLPHVQVELAFPWFSATRCANLVSQLFSVEFSSDTGRTQAIGVLSAGFSSGDVVIGTNSRFPTAPCISFAEADLLFHYNWLISELSFDNNKDSLKEFSTHLRSFERARAGLVSVLTSHSYYQDRVSFEGTRALVWQ